MAGNNRKTLLLCSGLQSSGTTLVSYCFLQRHDTDGVLDAENDILPKIDARLARPFAWYKTTIGCFRLAEMVQHYRDSGWQVRPLLVVRDLRTVWASLRRKAYGRNGITAEDPPLRMRLRRFIDDWRSFDASNAAKLRYEDLIADPCATLHGACECLGLPWDQAMLTWPKPHDEIAHPGNGNSSFWHSQGNGLLETIAQYQQQRAPKSQLSAADSAWLESEFADYYQANGYPLHGPGAAGPESPLDGPSDDPSFEVTRRYEWETRRKPVRWLLSRLGWRNKKLIHQRSWRPAA